MYQGTQQSTESPRIAAPGCGSVLPDCAGKTLGKLVLPDRIELSTSPLPKWFLHQSYQLLGLSFVEVHVFSTGSMLARWASSLTTTWV